MAKERFDEILGEKLREFREEPPVGLFDRIDSTIKSVEAKPAVRRPLWRHVAVRYAVAAALTAGVFATVFTVSHNNKIEEVAAISAVAETAEQPQEEQQEVIVQQKVKKAAKKAVLKKNEMLAQSVDPQKEITTSVTAVAQTPDKEKRPASATATKSAAGKSASERKSQRKSEAELEKYWREVLGEEASPRRQNRLHPTELSLYAGNVGVGRGDISASNIAKDPMFVNAVDGLSPSKDFSNGMMHGAPKAPAVPRLKHYMPVTIGFTLSYALNDWIFIESGLVYTNLFSRSENSGTLSAYERRRNLHYLGIPAAVSFNMVNFGNLSIYARVGGAAEGCISATDRYYIDGTLNNTEQLDPKGLQLSLDAVAGLNYSVWRGWGIYAESGISYYFAAAGQPESYRTENPLSMALRAGLRFTFE